MPSKLRRCLQLAAAAIFFAGCAPHVATSLKSAPLTASCSAADYGAVGDGIHDDRKAIQDALDACTTVTVPPGQYLVSKGLGYYNLRVAAGQALVGAGRTHTTLVQAPGATGSVRLLHVAGADATISDMTLDGNRAVQSVDEHRAGVFATGAPRTTIRRVTSQYFTGDGFYVHIGSNDVVLDDVLATSNTRNGVTFGGGTTGGTVTASAFVGNGAQQFDSEPGAGYVVDGVSISGSTFDAEGVSNDYVLTMSGSNASSRSRGWTVTGNVINGAVFAVYLDASLISNNTGVNPSTKPCFTVYRRSVGVSLVGNICSQTQGAIDNVPGIYIAGASMVSMPESILVVDNAIHLSGRAKSFGVLATGVSSVYVLRNQLWGPSLSAPGYAGVYLRTTLLDAPFRVAVVNSNLISNWSDAALRVAGNTIGDVSAVFESLEFKDNVLGDTASTPTQRRAVVIDGNAKPITQVRTGNTCTGGASCAGANL